jgi:uncharacterized Zn-finger protein
MSAINYDVIIIETKAVTSTTRRQHFLLSSKMYACNDCGAILNSTGAVKNHVDSNHIGKRFTCTKCVKSYTRQSNVTTHILRHHNPRDTTTDPERTLITLSIRKDQVEDFKKRMKNSRLQGGVNWLTQQTNEHPTITTTMEGETPAPSPGSSHSQIANCPSLAWADIITPTLWMEGQLRQPKRMDNNLTPPTHPKRSLRDRDHHHPPAKAWRNCGRR